MTRNEALNKVLDYILENFYMTPTEAKASFEYKLVYEIFDHFEIQLKAKDEEITKYDNITAELFKRSLKCLEYSEQLEAVIEKQGERIRYLEQQFRDLNPKGINK